MAEHLLTLRYEGRLAARHEMDAADIHHAYEGAKRLLAIHGYAYTEGRVPRNKLTETPYFSIRARALGQGSVELGMLIDVSGSAIWDATRNSFRQYFVQSLRSWLHCRETIDGLNDRTGPVHRHQDAIVGSSIDSEFESQELQREVHAGNVQAFRQMTRPIGLHADTVELLFDHEPLAQFGQRFPEQELTAAIQALAERLKLERPSKYAPRSTRLDS